MGEICLPLCLLFPLAGTLSSTEKGASDFTAQVCPREDVQEAAGQGLVLYPSGSQRCHQDPTHPVHGLPPTCLCFEARPDPHFHCGLALAGRLLLSSDNFTSNSSSSPSSSLPAPTSPSSQYSTVQQLALCSHVRSRA